MTMTFRTQIKCYHLGMEFRDLPEILLVRPRLSFFVKLLFPARCASLSVFPQASKPVEGAMR
jgi:hypothetical protein